MQVEILSLCDAATDYQGRLCILGAFDAIHARVFPATHPQCALALRLRFTQIEVGDHSIRLHLVNDDGGLVLPPIDAKLTIALNPGFDSASANMILAIQGLVLIAPGDYAVNLAVDGKQEASIPLYVRKQDG